MNESNGGNDENANRNVPALRKEFGATELVGKALRRAGINPDAADVSKPASSALPAEVRRIRRGKFFLSNHEQRTFGSMRRPIFEYWGHGVIVGEMVPFVRTQDSDPEGMWCYGAHNDFDLIPEFMKPSEWPEYTRTSTGWARKDGARRIAEEKTELSEKSLDDLVSKISKLKRLK